MDCIKTKIRVVFACLFHDLQPGMWRVAAGDVICAVCNMVL